MKNVTILNSTSDTANFALGAAATLTAVAVALRAKKAADKAVFKFVYDLPIPFEKLI